MPRIRRTLSVTDVILSIMQRYRMPKPMTWNVFVKRRRLDVEEFLTVNKIRSYDALDKWCGVNNVLPPTRDDVKGMFGVKRKKPAVDNPVDRPAEKSAKPLKKRKAKPPVGPEE